MQESVPCFKIKIIVKMGGVLVPHCGYTLQIGNPVVAECYDFPGETEFPIHRADIDCTLQVFRSQMNNGTFTTPKTPPRFFLVHKIKGGIHGDQEYAFDLDKTC